MGDLTAALRSAIVERIEAGDWPEVAARRAGVDADTWQAWIERGTHPPAGERARRYRELVRAVAVAEAVAEGHLVDVARGDDPRLASAAVAMLERRFPDRWAKRIGRPPKTPAQAAPAPKRSVVDELAARRRGV